MQKPKVGISRCLLGEKVRHNGVHKLDTYLRDTLGKYVDFVPLCPEVESGFGIPREPIQVHQREEGNRILGTNTKKDYTAPMADFIKRTLPWLESQNLSGFILKAKSPSCGVFRTRIYRESKGPNLNGRGLFAEALMKRFPHLPVEEEGRLHNPKIRENFIERLFVDLMWKELEKEPSVHNLMRFHQSMKYSLMAHSPSILKEMGPVVSAAKKESLSETLKEYQVLLEKNLLVWADRNKHRNVLDHMMGYFKKELDPLEKKELIDLIEKYQKEMVPLIVPVTLLKHYVKKYNKDYLDGQFYLHPHPMELMLRNHV